MSITKATEPQASLLDSDGENKAVRCFLMLYGSNGLTVGKMRQHMTRCGYPLWPHDFNALSGEEHLTKADAQTWIRYLLDREIQGCSQSASELQGA